jgi:hypothetical protein
VARIGEAYAGYIIPTDLRGRGLVSFNTPSSILPGLLVVAGVVALMAGYRLAGLILVGLPLVTGLGVLIWALFSGLARRGDPP